MPIRLRYSTIVNYGSMLYRLLVAVGFVVIIARKLSVKEFGLWGIIFSLTSMFISFTSFWNTWMQRFFARGYKASSGTALVLTLIYSCLASLIYVGIAYFESLILGWGFQYLLLGIPLLFLRIFESYVASLSIIVKPELIGYKGFIYDSLRLILAYVLLVALNMRLLGALLSVQIALLISIAYTLFVLLKTKSIVLVFSKDLIKQWLKGFYVPALAAFQGFLKGGLRAIVSWVSGSEVTVAFLNVGFASEAPMLRASQSVTPALYARTLRRPRIHDLEEALRLFMLFSGFMFVSFSVLSKTIASLYNPVYVSAHVIIPIVTLYAIVTGFVNIYATFISGSTRVDAEGIRSVKEVLFSPLFKLPLIGLLSIVFSYAMLIPLVLLVKGDHLLEALMVSLALIVGSVIVFPYLRYELKRLGSSIFPWREFVRISVASLASGVYYVLSGAWGITVASFWRDAPVLGFHIIVAALIYFGVLYILSPWLRGLIRSGLKYILKDVLKKFKREPYIKQ